MAAKEDNSFCLECSDDENYGMELADGEWIPPAKDIVKLYETIDKKGFLQLEWKCPGRRSTTPTNRTDSNYYPNNEHAQNSTLDKSDFDFQEEMTHLKLAVRPVSSTKPKGSAKKKTANFSSILSSIERHRKLDNMISDVNKSKKK